VYVEATMKGNFTMADASAGTYSVPIVLIKADGPGNGFGVVDVPNTVYFVFYNFEMCRRPPELPAGMYTHLWCGNGEGGLRLANQIYPLAWQSTEDYLFKQGYTYMAVQWDRAVTEHYGDGAFADGRKGWHTVRSRTAMIGLRFSRMHPNSSGHLEACSTAEEPQRPQPR